MQESFRDTKKVKWVSLKHTNSATVVSNQYREKQRALSAILLAR